VEKVMTSKKVAVDSEGTTGETKLPCSDEATKSSISRELHFEDALEDDDVREVLRGFHKLSEHPPVKKTSVK
jgi:hypothetical protein